MLALFCDNPCPDLIHNQARGFSWERVSEASPFQFSLLKYVWLSEAGFDGR